MAETAAQFAVEANRLVGAAFRCADVTLAFRRPEKIVAICRTGVKRICQWLLQQYSGYLCKARTFQPVTVGIAEELVLVRVKVVQCSNALVVKALLQCWITCTVKFVVVHPVPGAYVVGSGTSRTDQTPRLWITTRPDRAPGAPEFVPFHGRLESRTPACGVCSLCNDQYAHGADQYKELETKNHDTVRNGHLDRFCTPRQQQKARLRMCYQRYCGSELQFVRGHQSRHTTHSAVTFRVTFLRHIFVALAGLLQQETR